MFLIMIHRKESERIEELWFQKYRILKRLGSGGSAEVFLAEHQALSSFRAIKKIPKSEKLHDIWIREARILKNLSHPSIPAIYDFEEDGSYSYIIMEYLEGVSLKQYRKEHNLTEKEIGEISLQICRLLRYLHELPEPLLYLDLKPENLMVCGGSIKMVDFGAALTKEAWQRRGITMGTKGYAAPELFTGKALDQRSDIYSFGMVMFFLFTGESPQYGEKRIQNIDRLSYVDSQWKDIVNRCLRYLPGMRFSTAKSLEKRILSALGKGSEITDHPRICLAGAFPHIGVTHICLSLAVYFAAQGKNVCYCDQKEEGVVETLLLQSKNKKNRETFYGVHLSRGEETKASAPFDLEIHDYGSLEGIDHSALYQEQNTVLITGGKCWETGLLEQTLLKFEYPPILCINFVSGKAFCSLAKYYANYRCLRIPYQPEVFTDFSGQWKRFAAQLWEEIRQC